MDKEALVHTVRNYHRWTPEEEAELRSAVCRFGSKNWELMRRSPEFPLLRARTATMLKNKWYKLVRSDKQSVPSEDQPLANEQSEAYSYKRSFSAHWDASEDSPAGTRPCLAFESNSYGRFHNCQYSSSELSGQPGDVGWSAGLAGTGPLSEAAKKLEDSLSLLREALAIQVDANEAVAAAIESRDLGEGDEDTVRTAVYVASLAQNKAKRAREHVERARKEHAAALAQQEVIPVQEEDNLNLEELFGGIIESSTLPAPNNDQEHGGCRNSSFASNSGQPGELCLAQSHFLQPPCVVETGQDSSYSRASFSCFDMNMNPTEGTGCAGFGLCDAPPPSHQNVALAFEGMHVDMERKGQDMAPPFQMELGFGGIHDDQSFAFEMDCSSGFGPDPSFGY
uniref:Myb-like domain-containing protein n=1 Tax=Tetraselmis sp. GSL018 TaxID=582737 RepID=A0A061QXP0_9CHLO|eukprot:CAMPEP_0177612384 /NCGR_PEP_ID=MMETSP0419_2-20121207/21179_1 /TAXON_ID=582737 /ORGANISM="Tetraselmis sp., Strain GSL018" /LENGTH=395 /DNA_ID=CAMNT_0019108543 /DNA_START=302 /DNA_END=1489 /DNA_ORIENTATION=+